MEKREQRPNTRQTNDTEN